MKKSFLGHELDKSLIGMFLSEFDAFYAEFEIVHKERLWGSQKTQRGQKK